MNCLENPPSSQSLGFHISNMCVSDETTSRALRAGVYMLEPRFRAKENTEQCRSREMKPLLRKPGAERRASGGARPLTHRLGSQDTGEEPARSQGLAASSVLNTFLGLWARS